MKRMFSPGSGVSLVLFGVMAAVPTSPAAAATATCQPGEPKAVIQGADPRSEPDFILSGNNWVLNTIQLTPAQGANGSKPSRSNGGVYSWTQTGGTAVTLVTGTDNQGDLYVRFQSPDVAAPSPLTFRLDVSCLAPNGSLQTASDTVTVNIQNTYSPNRAPDASASASPAVVQDGQTVQLIGSGTDPDGNPLSYHWTQEDGPAVTLADPNAASTSFVAPNTAGSSGATLRFRLSVSDGTLSDVAEVTVNVSWVNDPPVTQLSCPMELLDLDEGEAFTLDGSASHDYEDGTALGYAWSGGPWTTTLSGWDGNAVLPLGSFTSSTINLTAPQLGYQQVGKFTYRLTATDTGGLYTFSDCEVFVHDVTKPDIAVPADIVAEATSAAGANVGAVEGYVVSASDVVDGPLPLVNSSVYFICDPAPGSVFALDATTPVLCSARDSAGNGAEASFTVTVEDTTGPVIASQDDVYAAATGNSQAVVHYTLPTASDLVDGLVAVTCVPASGSTFTMGATEVTCTAQDSHHNAALHVTFDIEVGYDWRGFFAPVDNPSTVNSVKAGNAIPVKFSLGGNQGLAIFAANSPASGPIACSATDGDAVEETVTAGSSSLQYDPVSGQYIYVWKTEKAWVGQCRVLHVKLRDGQVKSALFKFK